MKLTEFTAGSSKKMEIVKNQYRIGYLLADEVGLGKTIVAAMVIAKLAVDRMNKGESVRVAYICSNGALANENIRKLKEKIKNALVKMYMVKR